MSLFFDIKSKSIDFEDYIEEDFLVTKVMIDEKYHISWASSTAMVWRVVKILGLGFVSLETPKTRKPKVTHLRYLRELNKNAAINKSRRLKKLKREMEIDEKKLNLERKSETEAIMAAVVSGPSESGPAPLEDKLEVKKAEEVKTSGKRWSKEEVSILDFWVKKLPDLNPYQISDQISHLFKNRNHHSVSSKIYDAKYRLKTDAERLAKTESQEAIAFEESKNDTVIDESPSPSSEEDVQETKVVVEAPIEKGSVAYFNAKEVPSTKIILKRVEVDGGIFGLILADIEIVGDFKVNILNQY